MFSVIRKSNIWEGNTQYSSSIYQFWHNMQGVYQHKAVNRNNKTTGKVT